MTAPILVLLLLVGIGWAVFALNRGRTPAYICPACGTQGAKTETKGSIAIEIVLWLCLLVPGLIYSLWRLSTRHKICRACGSNVIPVSSPRGQQLVKGARTP